MVWPFCLLVMIIITAFSCTRVIPLEISVVGKLLSSVCLIYHFLSYLFFIIIITIIIIFFISLYCITFIGQNNQAGKSLLKTDYKEENSLDTNIKLAIKILVKTMDSTTPSPERIELLVMKKGANGEIFTETLGEKQVLTLIEEIQKEQELEAKKAEATTGDI